VGYPLWKLGDRRAKRWAKTQRTKEQSSTSWSVQCLHSLEHIRASGGRLYGQPPLKDVSRLTQASGGYQIRNNRGFINGWIGSEHIYGKCVKVEP
jgi:hypothetical protein